MNIFFKRIAGEGSENAADAAAAEAEALLAEAGGGAGARSKNKKARKGFVGQGQQGEQKPAEWFDLKVRNLGKRKDGCQGVHGTANGRPHRPD